MNNTETKKKKKKIKMNDTLIDTNSYQKPSGDEIVVTSIGKSDDKKKRKFDNSDETVSYVREDADGDSYRDSSKKIKKTKKITPTFPAEVENEEDESNKKKKKNKKHESKETDRFDLDVSEVNRKSDNGESVDESSNRLAKKHKKKQRKKDKNSGNININVVTGDQIISINLSFSLLSFALVSADVESTSLELSADILRYRLERNIEVFPIEEAHLYPPILDFNTLLTLIAGSCPQVNTYIKSSNFKEPSPIQVCLD
jgi:hypothetical protein